MTKSIKIQQLENGQKYFIIYEVRAEKHNGEVVTSERCLNKRDAEKVLKFIHENLSNLYTNAWIMNQIVWC